MHPPLPGDIFTQGQVLNNTYEVAGVLGRGGTGEVYLARNLISGRAVAIKALSRQFSGNEDYVELMRREEQMRDIGHEAVVRYTECSRSDDGHVFLVMDHVDGPSLFDEMQRRRMDARELLIVAHRVAEGLEAAHRRGIVHRDLSPDNIILRGGAAEQATIIDFGIAKDTAAGAKTIVGHGFAGKYEYAAPEQLEGQADPRSDLYALGASLLSAYRGEVPFAGATPGEIMRRKREPLNTAGVPEPLKGIVERLSAPAPAARPASAVEARGLIEAALRPVRAGSPRGGGRARAGRRGGRAALLLVALLLAVVGGLWQAGLLERFFTQPLPTASPYRLQASADPPRLAGNAPDPEAAGVLRQAFAQGAGAAAPEDALTLARGVPSPDWPLGLAGLLSASRDLEGWAVEAADLAVHVSGQAADEGARERIAADLTERARGAGLRLTLDLAAPPALLAAGALAAALADVARCGPMRLVDPPGGGYVPGDPVHVAGDVAGTADEARIRDALSGLLGGRALRLDANVLNDHLCAVNRLLPDLPAGGMSIRLTDGDTGAVNLSGVFGVGSNPVVDVVLPADVAEGWLWVILVDNGGQVFNLLPNIADAEHRLADIGTVEDGIRRIRVLSSAREFEQDSTRLAFLVSEEQFGKSEVVALLSRRPLFDTRRPRDESVASFAEGFAGALAAQPGDLVAVATRVLDARP